MTPSQRRIQTLLERLPPTPQERILALRSDPDVIALVVELLVAAAYWFNATAVEDFGGRLGPARDRGLVEQVVAAAFQTYGSVDPHPSPFAKAAMLFRGITQGHPFTDGNKRTGFLIAAYLLDLLGWAIPPDFDSRAVEDLAVAISSGTLREIDDIAVRLARLWGAGLAPE